MKINYLLASIFTLLFVSNIAFALEVAEVAIGKVTYVQVSGDHEAFYFTIDSLPTGILHFFQTLTHQVR